MSNELAVHNGHAPAVQPADTTPAEIVPANRVNDLIAWADSARAAASIAESLARTCFVPKAFQGKPAEVTAAILTGQEMGLSPMAALKSMHVIQGSAGLSAHALRGLVQSHGHDIWTEESTDVRAIVCGRRKGSDRVERSVWTIERAQKAGYVGKNPNYRTVPQDMLLARATATVARLIDADGLLGMPYSAEELADEAAQSGEAAKPRRVSRRKPEPAAIPEPELTPPTADEATEEEPDGGELAEPEGDDGQQAWPEVAQPGGGAA